MQGANVGQKVLKDYRKSFVQAADLSSGTMPPLNESLVMKIGNEK